MKPRKVPAPLFRPASAEERRRIVRQSFALEASASSLAGEAMVRICNMSRTGLLIETDALLRTGEVFTIELPEAGPTTARVQWQREGRFGCAFLVPVASSAVSAALLIAPVSGQAAHADPSEEPPGSRTLAGPSPVLRVIGGLLALLLLAALLLRFR